MSPEIEQCRKLLTAALAGLSPTEAEAPRGDKWSIARIVEHLDLTYARNAAGLARRLSAAALGRPTTARKPRTMKQRIGRFVIVQLGYFPAGRESPSMVVPTGRPFVEVTTAWPGDLAELDSRLAEAAEIFGESRVVLDHPVLGPFSVSDWRRFHRVHTAHHVKQIVGARRS